MRTLSILFLSLFCVLCYGQQQTYSLVPLPLQDLSAFVNPSKNWEMAGAASGNFMSNKVKTIKGAGILFNNFTEEFRYKPEANLFTRMEHADMILSFDFMMPKGSNSGIYFMGRYEIQLFDSWGIASPGVTDCGSIYERWNDALPEGKKGYDGHPARYNACLAPGLWQHMEIEFEAPKFESTGKKIRPARFAKVVLNGVVVQENVVLSGPTRAAAFTDEKPTGPLMIQGDHGPVLFRDIKYALLNEFKAIINDVQYEYYEGNFENFEQATPDKLTRKGNTELIDSRLADNPNKLCLIFTGKITVPEDNMYQFTLRKHGTARLEIDGKEVIERNDAFGDVAVSLNLTGGTHVFKLGYIKNFSWASTGIGLFISKANARPIPLHVPPSLPKISVTPLITVKATSEPELVRSFANFNEKKKTHVISVGDASGTHYMYNLSQAAILKTWRGDFLNVTDMWHERGEPQTATPLGAAISQSGRCALALVMNEENVLPDTLNSETDLIYKSLALDAKGYPTFNYRYKSLAMEDALKPNTAINGLTRTLTLKNLPIAEMLIVRMGEGSSIEEVSENTFAIDNRYYIQYIPQGKTKPAIRNSGNKKELVLEYNSKIGSSISYSIIW